jgi:toxin ParE1/3/4
LKPVLFHPAAEAEFDHSIGFYEERQIGLGLDLEREVLHAISRIHDSPTRWPKYKYQTRKFVLRRFPFNIFYLDLADYIWVVAVAHCSRKPDYWTERLKDNL